VFEIDGDGEPPKHTPMFGRGPIDHLGLQAASIDAFDTIRERLAQLHMPDDVRAVAHAVLAHRILLDLDRELRGASVASVVDAVLDEVPVPLMP